MACGNFKSYLGPITTITLSSFVGIPDDPYRPGPGESCNFVFASVQCNDIYGRPGTASDIDLICIHEHDINCIINRGATSPERTSIAHLIGLRVSYVDLVPVRTKSGREIDHTERRRRERGNRRRRRASN